MGQRLVVTVKRDDEDVCKVYYHWSAYTTSALLETKKILDFLNEHRYAPKKELQLQLIRFCEKNGGGIDGFDRENIQKLFPKEKFKADGYSRNEGLIALSEDGMDDMQKWSEGDVEINLDNDTVYFDVLWVCNDFKEYKKERCEWDDDFKDITINDIPEINFELTQFSIYDIDKVFKEIESLNNNFYAARYKDIIYDFVA